MIYILLLMATIIGFASILAVRKHRDEIKKIEQEKLRQKRRDAERRKQVKEKPKANLSFPKVVVDTKTPEDYIPRYIIEEIENLKKEYTLKNSENIPDFQCKFIYNKKGEAYLEFTANFKNGSITKRSCTWGATEGSIGNGKTKYTLKKKLADESQYRMDQRRNDPVFVEIEKVVLQVAKEYQYDFEDAYGKVVKYRNPNIKKAVCGGYSNAVAEAFENHPLVYKIENWSSKRGNHAWNVIILKDGRKLYCDATWYQGNSIDDEGYVVDIPVQNPVDLTFDIDEFNSLGGAINTATGKLLAVHFAWNDAKLRDR